MFGFNKNDDTADNSTKRLVVNKARCPQNHPCPSIRVCPTEALSQKGFSAPSVNQQTCIKCGKCVRYCPMRALSLE